MNLSKLAKYLDLTHEELMEMGLSADDIQQDKSPSGDAKQSYYFNVPDVTPDRILGKKSWSLGQRVEVDASVIDAGGD